MANSSHYEAAKQQEYAARSHAIAAEHLAKEARAADLAASRVAVQDSPEASVEFGSGWYHAEALDHAHRA